MVPKNLGYFSRSSAAEMECRGISSVEGASGWKILSSSRIYPSAVGICLKFVMIVCFIPASHFSCIFFSQATRASLFSVWIADSLAKACLKGTRLHP